MTVTPQVDMFNLFNHANYGAYNAAVNFGNFGTPTTATGDAYVPREFQFSFNVKF